MKSSLIVRWLFWRVKHMDVEALPDEPARLAIEWREDDLTRMEGIGPRVAAVPHEAGITSFETLSRAEPDEEKNVSSAAGLQKLQDELKGGTRK